MVDERVIKTGKESEVQDSYTTEQKDEEGEVSKQHLQDEMDSTRESISQTISQIAETVTTEAQVIRDTVVSKLDWREHARNHPAAVTIGAATIGFAVGYRLFKSNYNNQHTANGKATIPQSESYSMPKSKGQGFVGKLKTTEGYKHLTNEANNLLSAFISETINVGKAVLLPIAINKLSNMIQENFGDKSKTNTNRYMSSDSEHSAPIQAKQETS